MKDIKLDLFAIGGTPQEGYLIHGISDAIYHLNATASASTTITSVPLSFTSQVMFSTLSGSASPIISIIANKEETCWSYYELLKYHTVSFLKMYAYWIDYTAVASPSSFTINNDLMFDPDTDKIHEFAVDNNYDMFEVHNV